MWKSEVFGRFQASTVVLKAIWLRIFRLYSLSTVPTTIGHLQQLMGAKIRKAGKTANFDRGLSKSNRLFTILKANFPQMSRKSIHNFKEFSVRNRQNNNVEASRNRLLRLDNETIRQIRQIRDYLPAAELRSRSLGMLLGSSSRLPPEQAVL